MNKLFWVYRFVSLFLLATVSNISTAGMDNSFDCNEEQKQVKQFINKQSGKNYNPAGYESVNQKLIKIMPYCKEHVELNVSMAQIQMSLGKNIEAAKYINDALAIDPNHPDATHIKGVLYSLVGDREKSLELIKKSLILDPDNIDYLVNYCSTFEMFSMYKDAVNACSKASEHKKAPSAVYYIRGRAYEALGEKEKANLDYVKAKELGFTMFPK